LLCRAVNTCRQHSSRCSWAAYTCRAVFAWAHPVPCTQLHATCTHLSLSCFLLLSSPLQGALRQRQQRLKSSEEDEAAAAASSYRRVSASNAGAAHTPAAEEELQAATPELAQQLRKRQEAAEIARRHSEGEAQRQHDAAAGRSVSLSADGAAGSSDAPAWSNATAPFGSELASVLQKM
jgi:hypothetical protein